ncbi:phosphoribosylglycinamide synthetase [Geopyxis carbonaria]|nr:phosphoribosylglycinamide synthetase [Geopyxis carbonaria]
MKILIIGSGGREHALAWKLSQSTTVDAIYVAPGNGGTQSGIPKVTNVAINAEDFQQMVNFAVTSNIDLVVPGPEVPLVAGIESHFRKVGIPCFGPSKEASRMEGSKSFSKDFMHRHGIPSAEYRNFCLYDEAKQYLDSISHKIVIKASGLAAGKGVIIPETKEEAQTALKEMMVSKEFGSAGDEVVIEEFLEGDELSILAFSDGYTIKMLPPAQDHKRIFDGDRGPNTGGMGCYAPTRIASQNTLKLIQDTILQPTIDGMRHEGYPFKGMLFTGLMMTKDGPKVLEYNVRFGDPETQTVLPLLGDDSDLAEILLAAAEGYLDGVKITIREGFAATVVISAGGYPGNYEKNTEIDLRPVSGDTQIFHAGTAIINDKLVTAGGRVIAASAFAETLEKAVEKAYSAVKSITFDGMHYRKDIAHRAFKQKSSVESLTYEGAGVSVDAGNALVEKIKKAVRSTRIPGTDAEIGGFGGVFDMRATKYSDPLLVAGIDGVGTKLKIACATGKHHSVGIDLVAMSVNDLLAQGAEPLFFLDYFSTSKLSLEQAGSFIEGVADGCRQSGCALIGGETAEMPGMYEVGDYDAAGCAVGAVDREHLLPQLGSMQEGDQLVGIQSNGLHSNGYSLVRKIIELQNLQWDDPAPWNSSSTVGDELLIPTRIYVKPVIKIVKQGLVKGLSHITGGGLTENIPRMLPPHLAAEVDVSCWEQSPMFRWLKRAGSLQNDEYARTWNTGIGLVLVVSPGNVGQVISLLAESGERAMAIGKLVQRVGSTGCELKNMAGWKN